MTKREFLGALPDFIEHKVHGYGELEIVSDDEIKTACYRHKSNLASGGNSGNSWEEVFLKISRFLKDIGYYDNP